MILRRLERSFANAEPPDEDEARESVARLGIDPGALHARVLAKVDALEAEAARRRCLRRGTPTVLASALPHPWRCAVDAASVDWTDDSAGTEKKV